MEEPSAGILSPQKPLITVQASRHPLKPDWVFAEVQAGQTIRQIAGDAPVLAYLDGKPVDPELQPVTFVTSASHLVLWPIPADGDDLVPVLQIGVAVAAFAVGGWIGGFAGAAAAAGISYIGNYAISQLIPPPPLEIGSFQSSANAEQFNRLAALTGQSNRLAAFSPIPRVYGTHRFFPPIPMTAKPYTEIVGRDQYLRMLVCLGYGPLDIGGVQAGGGAPVITEQTALSGIPIKIGETDIHAFDNVEFELGSPDQITLYTDQIIETDPAWTTTSDISGIPTDAAGQWVTDGLSAVRTTEVDTDEISIDVAGALFSMDREANTTVAKVQFKIEYRETGTSTWLTRTSLWEIESNKKETVRKGYRWSVPTGQYDVRLTRLQTYHADFEGTANELSWSALRSIRSRSPFTVPDTVVMALRIKASDQLNGRVDDLSVLATSILDVWDGVSWSAQATSNPAWVFADIWTGKANRRPIAHADLDQSNLLDWAQYCENEGFTYSAVLDRRGTTLERIEEVVSTGLATWNFSPDGKIGVVRDTLQSVPKMIITPRNSWDFSFSVTALDIPDALRVRYIDAGTEESTATWENTERLVFDDGYDESNAEKYETLQAAGVTDSDHAWKIGRFHLAQQRLRPERFSFKQDVQHLRYQRGDLLSIQHPVIVVGIAAGRVKEIETGGGGAATAIIADELVLDTDLSTGSNYGIRLQRADGTIATVGASRDATQLNRFVLEQTISNVSIDDLFVFGEAGLESIDVKVSEIRPEGDLSATVICSPRADGVLEALTGTIPDYDPGITEPTDPERIRPITPTIVSVTSDASSIEQDADGTKTANVVVDLTLVANAGFVQEQQLRYRIAGTEDWVLTSTSAATLFAIPSIPIGVTLEVQARGIRGDLYSAWSATATHTVIDLSALAPNIPVINSLSQFDKNQPPVDTIISYIEAVFSLIDGGAQVDLVELRWQTATEGPYYATIEAGAGVAYLQPVNYGEQWSVYIRGRSITGVWSEWSDASTITLTEPSVDPAAALAFLTGEITESQLYQDLNSRIDLIDTPDTGLIDRMDVVESDVSSLQTDVSANSSAITGLDSRVTANEDGISANATQITALQADISSLFTQNGFEDGEYSDWTVPSGNTLLQSTDALEGSAAGLIGSTLTAPTSSGTTAGVYLEIPEKIALTFAGQTIRVSVWAKHPASNASAEFAIAYSTNGAGNSGWQTFQPTTTWAKYSFTYAVPEASADGADYLGIWADTSGTGAKVLIDVVSLESITQASDIPEIDANTSAISSLDARVSTNEYEISSNASSITALESTVNDSETGVSANATAIDSLDTRVTTNESDISAQASSITQLQTTVDGNTTTISENATSIDGLEGQYTVKIDVNGAVAGFGLANTAVDNTGDSAFSEFYVNADRFAILPQTASPSEATAPFVVQNDQVYLDSALIQDAAIDNAKIANLSVDTAQINTAAITTLKVGENEITQRVTGLSASAVDLTPADGRSTLYSINGVPGTGITGRVEVSFYIFPINSDGNASTSFYCSADFYLMSAQQGQMLKYNAAVNGLNTNLVSLTFDYSFTGTDDITLDGEIIATNTDKLRVEYIAFKYTELKR